MADLTQNKAGKAKILAAFALSLLFIGVLWSMVSMVSGSDGTLIELH